MAAEEENNMVQPQHQEEQKIQQQEFHLKWNNHGLNTLSSFQKLFESQTLVDVSLSISGKILYAHRIVLAASSEYFYKLFKELPDKHPVIVFKDASENILNDLLLFMYRGEVQVKESSLSEFLKFAESLQVKGLSSREELSSKLKSTNSRDPSKYNNNNNINSSSSNSNDSNVHDEDNEEEEDLEEDNNNKYSSSKHYSSPLFPPILPSTEDYLTQLSSPTLYRALQRQYQLAAAAAAAAAASSSSGPNGTSSHPDSFSKQQQQQQISRIPFLKDFSSLISPLSPPVSESEKETGICRESGKGRGSRLERMIAAEFKVLNEYSESSSESLPVMTPELMKSRRTHSLQLAIGEILHSRASVQSAATKYQIPRETLRRHYQRYLKVVGIKKEESGSVSNGSRASTPSRPSSNSSLTNNNISNHISNHIHQQTHISLNNNNTNSHNNNNVSLLSSSGGSGGKHGIVPSMASLVAAAAAAASSESHSYSSLMEIGQAYGIWNAELAAEASDIEKTSFSPSKKLKGDESQKLIIDEKSSEGEEMEDEEPNEKLSPCLLTSSKNPSSSSTSSSVMETSA